MLHEREFEGSNNQLRERVLEVYLDALGGMTADEAAARLGLSVLAIRPRVSELVAGKTLKKTGFRRENESGQMANVWIHSSYEVPDGFIDFDGEPMAYWNARRAA